MLVQRLCALRYHSVSKTSKNNVTVSYGPLDCSLRDLSPSLVEENRVCGSVSGGGVCYSGDSVGSVAVYFCDDGYTLEGDTTRECLSSGLWNGSTPQCVISGIIT